MKRHLPSSLRVPLRRLMSEGTTVARPLRMAVDLTQLSAGGASGGVKPFILEYLRELASLEGDRITFIFLTWSASHDELRSLARSQDELVCVRHDGATKPLDLSDWRSGELSLPAAPHDLLLQLEVDLFYSPLGLPQHACPGVPTISTIVDVLHRDYPATLPPHANAIREDLFRGLVKISDRFQCISNYTADRLHHHYGVPLDRTFCSYLPVHTRLETVSNNQPALPVAAPYFLYPANFWKHKNHETLLVAYHSYRAKNLAGAWDLVLTGHEDERMRQVMEVATNLGLKGHVHFLRHLPDKEFSQVWRHAGALVFPSLHEGFGIPLLEAMHFGIPILSSTEGSLREVAGSAAIYADARNPMTWAAAMARIAHEEPLRSDLVARGHRRLAEYSLAKEVRKFRDVVLTTANLHSDRFWHKGLHIDGWIEQVAVFGLPPTDKPMRIRIGLRPTMVTRRLRVYSGSTPLGGFDVAPESLSKIEVEVDAGQRALILEVPDASNLNPDDHRVHGVIVASLSASSSSGEVYDLLGNRP